ncbi:MAG: mitochondrial fission ELM1 family protein [Pseudomonadota bacterium]
MQADCWIVTDGARGNEKQCLALAHYLRTAGPLQAPAPRRFRIALRQPWDALAPRLVGGVKHALKPVTTVEPDRWQKDLRDLLQSPLPRVVLSCGRRAALASRMLRARSRGALCTVQILNPRVDPAAFSWVVCPHHDRLTGANVLRTEGALHEVDDAYLATAREDWPQFESLTTPRVAVLIGASNGAYTIDQAYLSRLLAGAAKLAEAGSLLVTTSRRTPLELRRFAAAWLAEQCPDRHFFFSDQPGERNPYPGLLAYADRIVVSSDSVNMVSEALGTGCPVHSLQTETKNERFALFAERLVSSGRLLSLDDTSQPSYEPLRETAAVAERIGATLTDGPT